MNIVVYYQSGRIDEFDTSNFCNLEPFKREGQNMTTEFRVRLDLLEPEGLLLEINWYDANPFSQAITSKADGSEESMDILHAVRRSGRRIRLVSQGELADIAKIICNGELMVWRQGSELINAVKFSGQEILCFSNATTTSINARAVAIFEYLQNANPGLSDEVIAQMMGYSKPAIDMILADEAANHEEDLFDPEE